MERVLLILASLLLNAQGAFPLQSIDSDPYHITGERNISFEMSDAALRKLTRSTNPPQELKVALVLTKPEGHPAKFLRLISRSDLAVEEVIVDSKSPTDIWLEKVLRTLFPTLEVINGPERGATYDLVLQPEIKARITTTGIQSLEIYKGFELTITLTVKDNEGNTIDRLTGHGSADFGKTMYWSPRTRMQSVGPPALQEAANQLLKSVEKSQPINLIFRELQEAKARPANLVATATFNDEKALFPDKRLNAGETAAITVKIQNQGPGKAFGVKVVFATESKHISVPSELILGDLDPQEQKILTTEIAADLAIVSGIERLTAKPVERRGYGGRPISMEIATESLVRPALKIADVAINDRYGRAQGDGDGQPANGEILEAVVKITNQGPGNAPGGRLKTSSTNSSIKILDTEITLQPIAAHTVTEARVLLQIPLNTTDRNFTLSFEATDIRGTSASTTKREETWNLQLKRPFLKVDHRVYDGNSPDSAGNRDGVANNGEKIELALRATNKGDLAAHQVSLQIEALDTSVKIEDAELKFNDLPAGTEAEEKRISIFIPRTYGAKETSSIPFLLRVTQRHFPVLEQKLIIAFQHQRPEILIQLNAPTELTEGEITTIGVQAHNTGSSAAKDVQIEIKTETSGIKLLDARDVPQEVMIFNVGEVPAKGLSRKIIVKVMAQRGLDSTRGLIQAVARQADFQPAEQRVSFAIGKETALVIPPTGSSEASSLPALGPGLSSPPATISFLRYDSGERLSQEAIVLRFEVQAARELQDVRLHHNGRSIAIARAEEKRNPDSNTLVGRYEAPIGLFNGENVFEVIALTVEGQRSTRSLSLIRVRQEGKIWVAAIGVSKYSDPSIPDLSFADRDAKAIYDYYRDVIGLPKEQVFLLSNEQATLKNIKSVLGTQLQSQASNPEDTVIVYFAGHGQKEADVAILDSDGFNKYLLPHDASPSDLFSTAIAMDEIAGILRRLRSNRIVFILDSCFSGGAGGRSLFDPHSSPRSTIDDKFLERVADAGKGRVVLTASGPNEVALERPDLGHGIFTHYLLLALKGQADENRDGLIDVDEAYRFTWSQVVAATKGRQHPVRRAPNSQGTVVLGRSLSP